MLGQPVQQRQSFGPSAEMFAVDVVHQIAQWRDLRLIGHQARAAGRQALGHASGVGRVLVPGLVQEAVEVHGGFLRAATVASRRRRAKGRRLKFAFPSEKQGSMAGHSKWANIQHRKGRQDEKRGKAWTRVIREIMVAARLGGGDPTANPRLRLAIEKAKAVNLPVDTVKRNIDKATGNLEGVSYEEIRYEGYGIGGAAIIVDCMTDNRVRTVAEVRHAFSKYGGNLGQEGSVAFQFKHCGQFVFAPGTSEDQVMEVALEAGAEDVIADDDGAIEVLTAPPDFEAVKSALEAAGLKPDVAEVTMRAENEIELAGEDAQRMQKLLDVLEDLDDVQEVYHNAALEE
jgi:YebC/PmpR family DNA-binding regulatory protein